MEDDWKAARLAPTVPGTTIPNNPAAFVSSDVGAQGQPKTSATTNTKNTKKYARRKLAEDLRVLEGDPMALGLSEAEQQQMIDQGAQAATTQRQAQQTQIARDQLNSADFQARAYADAQQRVAQQAGAAASAAATNASNASIRLAAQRADEIKGRLAEDVARKQANERFWRDVGVQGAFQIIGALTNAPAAITTAGTGSKTTEVEQTEVNRREF